MKKFSLDNNSHAILIIGMLGLFGSVAYEATHQGMTDPGVAVSEAAYIVVAKSDSPSAAEDLKLECTLLSKAPPVGSTNTH